MCNSGVGLTPIVSEGLHHFSAGGLYNGLVLLIDDETRTYWDHITGEAVHGPLRGARLEFWGVELTSAGALCEHDPTARVFSSRLTLRGRLFSWLSRLPFVRGRLPPGFKRTMRDVDARRPGMEIGLGVVTEKVQRFYPVDSIGDGIDDRIGDRPLRVRIGATEVPYAEWEDGSRPLQLFSRWYGFSLTFPDCEVYGLEP